MKLDILLKQVTLWHMVPIAVGFHGVLLMFPIQISNTKDSQKVAAIPTVIVPPVAPSIPVGLIAKSKVSAQSSPLKAVPLRQPAIVPAVPVLPPVQSVVKPSIVPEPTKPKASPIESPANSSQDAVEKPAENQKTKAPEKTIAPNPEAPKQAQSGCKTICGEWKDGDWYANIASLQQTLEKQGYRLRDINDQLEEEHGIRAILAENGQESFYLLMVQGDDGIQRFLRSPELLTTRQAVLDRIQTELTRNSA